MRQINIPCHAFVLLLAFASAAWSVEVRSDFDAGRRCYDAADFKKAALHFTRAAVADPSNAEAHFWLGKSYENLADIGGPILGLSASLKARAHLGKALQLAPANLEYRREYFSFLTVSDQSPKALSDAESIIQNTPRSNPDYPFMSPRLDEERRARSSAEGRIEAAFSALPQSLVTQPPAATPHDRRENSLALLAPSGQ